jgi:hypothetical protein
VERPSPRWRAPGRVVSAIFFAFPLVPVVPPESVGLTGVRPKRRIGNNETFRCLHCRAPKPLPMPAPPMRQPNSFSAAAAAAGGGFGGFAASSATTSLPRGSGGGVPYSVPRSMPPSMASHEPWEHPQQQSQQWQPPQSSFQQSVPQQPPTSKPWEHPEQSVAPNKPAKQNGKRALNAYQLFGKDFFRDFPDHQAPFAEKSVKQGEAWRAMSDAGRAHYDRMAAAEQVCFKGVCV